MPINPNDYQPHLNDWYRGSGVYKGSATLSVSGVEKASGPAEVEWNDLGDTKISMELPSNQFILAHELFEADEIAIRLRTDTGGLFTTDRAFAHHNQVKTGVEGANARIELTAARSTFDANSANLPSYWVIPIVNFIADLRFISPAISTHPLRIYTMPNIPEELGEQDALFARVIAIDKERLIPFSFDGSAAFIEKLSDYETKSQSLVEKRADHQATAIAVGSLPTGASTDLGGLFNWLPTDILLH